MHGPTVVVIKACIGPLTILFTVYSRWAGNCSNLYFYWLNVRRRVFPPPPFDYNIFAIFSLCLHVKEHVVQCYEIPSVNFGPTIFVSNYVVLYCNCQTSLISLNHLRPDDTCHSHFPNITHLVMRQYKIQLVTYIIHRNSL